MDAQDPPGHDRTNVDVSRVHRVGGERAVDVDAQTFRRAAIALSTADLLFAVLHLAHKQGGVPASSLWRVDLDRTYPETFQYVQLAGIAVGLVVIARRQRISAARPWAAIYGVFVIDDALSVHERLGEAIADGLGLPVVAGLRPRDLAEILLAGVAGLAILAVMMRTWRSGGPRDRWLHIRMGGLVIAFAVFAVGVDAVHMLAIASDVRGLGLFEDGGEMVVASVTLAFVAGVAAAADEAHSHSPATG